MRRALADQSDRIRETARSSADHSRIWRMLGQRGEGSASASDHHLEPREPGLGICRHCGLDRINHSGPTDPATNL